MNLLRFGLTIVAFICGITIHEFAHAWTAYRLGDTTAARQGRLTLNPLAHLDPVGTIMLLVSALGGIGFGWGKPVPVNAYRLRTDPRIGMGIVAAAGPLSNVLLATVLAMPIRLGLVSSGLVQTVLVWIALVNIALAVFNLIPLFPLDGFNVLMGILTRVGTDWAYRLRSTLARLEAQGPMIFILVIIADQSLNLGLLWRIMGPPMRLLSRLIIGVGI